MITVKYYTVEFRVFKNDYISKWILYYDENLNYKFESLSEAKMMLKNLCDFHRRIFKNTKYEYIIKSHEDNYEEEYRTFQIS